MAFDLRRPVNRIRLATVVVGTAVLIMGMFSHFTSAWTSYEGQRVHRIVCIEVAEYPIACPDIAMERFFVVTVTICCILSLAGLISSTAIDLGKPSHKLLDLGYHVVAALMLLIAAIVYIVSTEQIEKLEVVSEPERTPFRLRRVEKLVAGILAIFDALVYGVTAYLIAKQRKCTVEMKKQPF